MLCGSVYTLTYDAENQLTAMNRANCVTADGSHGSYSQRSYAFDNAGNITNFESTGTNLYYQIGAHKHAVTHVGGTTAGYQKYWYDQNGNATRRISGSQDITLTYDAENRLTAMSGSVTSSYVYDADGNRVKETIAGVTRVFVGNTYELDNGTVKKYYYAGATRVAERSGGVLYYLLSDHLGSTALTLDSSGNRLNTNTELRYYPYGGARYNTNNQLTTYRFTGQRWDSGTALYFYQSRWYDPVVGRFLQADTLIPQPQDPQNLNRYSYCGSNPLKYVDSSGHNAIEFWGGAGGGGGVALLMAVTGLAQSVSQQTQSLTVTYGPELQTLVQTWYVHGNSIIAAADQFSQATQNASQAGNTADPGGQDPNDPRFRKLPDHNSAQSGTLLRQQYESAVRALSDRAAQMRSGGRPLEEIARTLHAERRALGEQFKAMTPTDALEQIYARNIERYGDRLGPSIDWLIERGLRQGKTMEQIWESIITSASRPGGQDIIPQLLGQ